MIPFSIVVLNHDYANYLPTAIDSARAQTYGDVEVIVVDDASTDNSRAVIESYGERVIPVFHEVNLGQGAAINSGAAVAGGDVIWFLDADDALLPGACAAAAKAFEEDKSLAKFHTPLAVIDDEGNWAGALLPANPDRLATGDIAEHVLRYRAHGWPPMSGNAYSVGALTRVLPIPAEEYRQAADSFLNEQVAICGPIGRTDQPVAAYRRHGSNQFAGKPLDIVWLRRKITRELVSHEQLGLVAWQLAIDGYLDNPADVLDISFLGYRLASLRLDPEGHPLVDPNRRDTRTRLAIDGIRAASANRHLATSDRLIRAVWFPVIAAAPEVVVATLLGLFMPDGPSEPFWRRRRHRRNREQLTKGTALVPTTTITEER